MLWLLGHPGTGKTTLIKHASHNTPLNKVDAVKTHQITFFFYSLGTKLQRTSEGLLRALLYQILEPFPDDMLR